MKLYAHNIYERIYYLNAYRYVLIIYLHTSSSLVHSLCGVITSLQAWFAAGMNNYISSLKWVKDATAAVFAKPVGSCTDEVKEVGKQGI